MATRTKRWTLGEYWIIDPEAQSIRVVRQGESDQLATRQLNWAPAGAPEPLVIEVAAIFG